MTDNKLTLAQRREALVAQCAVQRAEASQERSMLFAPTLRGGGGLLGMLSGGSLGRVLQSLKGRGFLVPLAVAGIAVGLVAARPARMVSLITTGVSLWKLAQPVLEMLQRPSREQY
ncbi:MAG: hypothetical protein V4723_08055 [Pseudomonadota bacterium]